MARRFLPSTFLVLAGLAAVSNATFGDLGGKFPYVGRTVYRKGGQGPWLQSASGVAVSPHWVITASHAGGNAFEQEGKVYEVDDRVFCPDADLLMLHLKEPVAYFVPIAYEPFSALKGKTVTIVGAGQTAARMSSGWTTTPNPNGTVHAAANTIDETTIVPVNVPLPNKTTAERRSQCLIYDLDDPDGGNGTLGGKAVPNEGGQAGQDSGGAWLVRSEGKLRLVALCGYVSGPPSDPSGNKYGFGAIGLGIHLAPYKAWIQKNLVNP